MMFGESPFATAPFGSYAGEARAAYVTISGTNATFNQSAFTIFGHASVDLGGTGAAFNTGDFTVETFSNVINMPVSLTGVQAKFGQDLRVWRKTTAPTKTFIWTLEN